jgi:hypothetical protein
MIERGDELMGNLSLIERARQMLNAASRNSTVQCSERQNTATKTIAKAADHITKGSSKPIWMETEASVTECKHEFVATDVRRPSRRNGANTFTISFTYYAHARTYYDRFTSAEPKAQGERFSIFYNALDPKQNAKSASVSGPRSTLSAIGIAGYILISGLFLTIARG